MSFEEEDAALDLVTELIRAQLLDTNTRRLRKYESSVTGKSLAKFVEAEYGVTPARALERCAILAKHKFLIPCELATVSAFKADDQLYIVDQILVLNRLRQRQAREEMMDDTESELSDWSSADKSASCPLPAAGVKITTEEIEGYKYPAKYAEVLKAATANMLRDARSKPGENQWEFLKKKKGVEILRRKSDKKSGLKVNAFMGRGNIMADPATIASLVFDTERDTRRKFDEMYKRGEIIERVDDRTQVQLQVYEANQCLIAIHRDFLFLSHVQVLPSGAIIVANTSLPIPQDIVPVSKKCKRGIIHSAGYLIEPRGSGNGSRVTYVVTADLGGLPPSILNLVGDQQPLIVASLRSAVEDGGVRGRSLTFIKGATTPKPQQKSAPEEPTSMTVDIPPAVPGTMLQTGERFNLKHRHTRFGVGCAANSCHSAMMEKWNHEEISADHDVPIEEVKRQASEYLEQYYRENKLSKADYDVRIAKVLADLDTQGYYDLTYEELQYGFRLAWRNSGRCINRIQWKNLEIIDARDVTTNDEMIDALWKHLRFGTNGGNIISTLTCFPQRKRGTKGARIWNDQIVRYAGYERDDGTVVGDPANIAMTNICLKMGWRGEGTAFDVLPIIVQAEGAAPKLIPIPPELVREVPISHPEYKWFSELALKWYALPCISAFGATIGGCQFTCIPFNGWYQQSEIGRNLGDTDRYDKLPEIALRMGLNIGSNLSLWKDKAQVELHLAILHSFTSTTTSIVDHHSASDSFISHYRKEMKLGRGCPGDWTWIVPPIGGSTTKVFHLEMINYIELPQYVGQKPAYKDFDWSTITGVEEKRSRMRRAQTIMQIKDVAEKPSSDAQTIRILYATETGKSEAFAMQLKGKLSRLFKEVKLLCMDEVEDCDALFAENGKPYLLLIVTSTFGEGAPPGNAAPVVSAIKKCTNDLSHIGFGVFGLGSKAYPKFNACGRFFDARLAELGATRLVSLGEGDEQAGQAKAFRSWQESLLGELQGGQGGTKLEELPEAEPLKLVPVPGSKQKALPNVQGKGTAKSLFHTKIAGVTPLTKTTSKISISLETADFNWSVGDHLGVAPQNDGKVVEFLLKSFGIDEQRADSLVVAADTENARSFLKSPISLRGLFQEKLDVTTPPAPEALARWAEHCSSESEAREMANLGEGAGDYDAWVGLSYPGMVQVFQLFPSLKLPIEVYLEDAPALQPRFYSISSSPSISKDRIDLTVARVEFDCLGVKHYGVASNFLCSASTGQPVSIFFRSAPDFHLPKDSATPLICVGPGTGIAPFRGFWQELSSEKREMHLYFGCRVSDDELYAGERKDAGMVTNKTALSRATRKKVYVNDKMEEDSSTIRDLLLTRGGYFYVCGDVRMANGVEQTLKSIFAKDPAISLLDADAHIEKMKTEGRFRTDIFGVTLHVDKQLQMAQNLYQRFASVIKKDDQGQIVEGLV